MDFVMTEPAYKLLIFLFMIRGMYGDIINYYPTATAVEGQNISLQCIVGEEQNFTIIQLEWIKQRKDKDMTDQKIVVFHPGFPIHYFQSGFLLETVTSSKTRKLQGSVLTLREVRVNDTGNYICEITSYPSGSIKRITKLQVTEPPASVKMSYPYGFIKEGDDMKITCSAIPPPIRYKLKRSKNKIFWLESSNGEFTLPHVTRNDSDMYICLPEWDSLVPNLQGLNATVEVTVNFLDGIECNTSSSLNVSAGEDVAISCIAKASQYLQYKWMRGDTTLSLSDTLSLTSMTSEQSGTYKLTAVFLDNQLQTDMEIFIQVLSTQSEGMTTPLPVRTTKHLSSFTSDGTSSWSTDTSVSTSESGHFLTSTVKPNDTLTTLQPRNTSHPAPLTDSSSPPPVGNASTLHASTVKCINTSTDSLSTTPDPATRGRESPTTVTTQKSITAFTTPKASKSSAYIAVPIVLLLLGLIVLLYRRHQNQKRMDMPPPFKPPPPPVKYTSMKNHDVPMTDILV
ncbi:T-cell surface protein tactile-like [Carassius auratus]|uniref:T-cell surface protein tactile-like n=1 Tax=Carassius auratus TaxID=7957 RepID=A0A6P6Q768_CARAU|nr:T-cell surface protein tactile-like [Carassius auratus]